MPVDLVHDGSLLIIRLVGIIVPADLQRVADEVLALEARAAVAPPRLTDFRGILEIRIGFVEMAALAERSVARPLSTPIRSALLVNHPVQLGFARMFQTLNTHPMVTVQIFEDETAARTWLAGR